uniref:NADH-ubiquinone oxidoreductase chain 1 n=1 Tax=Echiniscus testudo TaxID=399800 RepID=A0A348BR64_ECHTS|nr:NADH dehydrogenase subunit 1 [Echiniscus testudo]
MMLLMVMLNFNYFLNQFVLSIFIILSIAFYTLMERKILSYQQNRKGPNKISMIGILQPVSDAMKLLTKKEFKLTFSNNIMYWTPPFYSFFMFILVLNLFPSKMSSTEMNLSFLFFFSIIALTGFSTIIMGWASNSKYTILGSLRALAQSISYEILLIISVFLMMYYISSFSLMNFQKEKPFLWSILMLIMFIFFISLVCEVNRAPFDLSEGESELVSGFNTEYGMTKFALIFLTEYGMMIFMSLVMTLTFNNYFEMLFFFKMILFMMIFLWLRSSYPRMRYDILMYFTWKNALPITLLLSLCYFMIL